ncbi:MAG: hypothetical protein ACT4PX_08470 [Actinomycetota bacterium]
MYEYTSDVFAVGLEGFAPVDDDKIARMAEEGWEPAHMTTVHNGFAAVVLFRRERGSGPPPAAAAAKRVRRTAPAPATGRPSTREAKAAAKASRTTKRSRG